MKASRFADRLQSKYPVDFNFLSSKNQYGFTRYKNLFEYPSLQKLKGKAGFEKEAAKLPPEQIPEFRACAFNQIHHIELSIYLSSALSERAIQKINLPQPQVAWARSFFRGAIRSNAVPFAIDALDKYLAGYSRLFDLGSGWPGEKELHRTARFFSEIRRSAQKIEIRALVDFMKVPAEERASQIQKHSLHHAAFLVKHACEHILEQLTGAPPKQLP